MESCSAHPTLTLLLYPSHFLSSHVVVRSRLHAFVVLRENYGRKKSYLPGYAMRNEANSTRVKHMFQLTGDRLVSLLFSPFISAVPKPLLRCPFYK